MRAFNYIVGGSVSGRPIGRLGRVSERLGDGIRPLDSVVKVMTTGIPTNGEACVVPMALPTRVIVSVVTR
jgi:hypothetical protein